ncbi:MAG: ABC transporter permease [Acidimicrobiia bacterium]|nr:MAG: ABC transporter permease [Acidimicrobiia bacterium]
MTTATSWVKRSGPTLISLLVAVAVAIVLLLLADAPPLEVFRLIFDGAFGSADRTSATLLAWVPLVLASAGLVVTFAAGLWNIGVEGQIIFGAIITTWLVRVVEAPTALVIPLAILAGILGGAVWSVFAGVLKTHGKVNEIFGGLGLDFVAAGLATYLVIGPWAREGVASTSGTDLFRMEAWMPTVSAFGTDWPVIPIALALLAVVGVYFLMRGTLFGLRLKAVGQSPKSAFLLGIPTNRYLLSAFLIGGALAGIAGTIQVTAFHHKLVPAISGGYGFLGILVVLLAGYDARWIAPIALFFTMIATGSTQLDLRLGLDSAIGDVLQGQIVLFVLLGGGFAILIRQRRRRSAAQEPTVEEAMAED